MKVWKKFLAVCMMVIMVTSITACGGTDKKSKDNTAGDKDYTKIVYAYVSFNTIPEDISEVEEAINVITREKIGVEVELLPLSIGEYSQRISLAMQGGEQMDVFHSLGDFAQSVSANQAYDISDIIDTSAPEAKEIVGEKFLTATTSNTKIYGIPANKAIAMQPQFIYRQDIMDETGIDPSTITSIDDMTAVLEKVKELHPDMIPLAPMNTGDTGVIMTIPEVDFLTDDYTVPKGVLMGDSTEVVDFYSTEEFKEKILLMRDWYNKGLILKDAATSTSVASELLNAGTAFSFIASYSYPPEDTAVAISAQTGQTLGAVNIGEAYVDTTHINAITWMVASTSKNPEAALKFLNLTYSDKDVVNLIIYGIEGRDYVVNEDGSVRYPDGLDSNTVPYTAQLSCGIVGNQFIQHIMEGTNPDSLAIEQDMNKNAKSSKALGFLFDTANVKTQYTTVINVINQYLPALQCGSVDPEKELPKFIQKLKESGMDDIIGEKQKQLDEWLIKNQ